MKKRQIPRSRGLNPPGGVNIRFCQIIPKIPAWNWEHFGPREFANEELNSIHLITNFYCFRNRGNRRRRLIHADVCAYRCCWTRCARADRPKNPSVSQMSRQSHSHLDVRCGCVTLQMVYLTVSMRYTYWTKGSTIICTHLSYSSAENRNELRRLREEFRTRKCCEIL